MVVEGRSAWRATTSFFEYFFYHSFQIGLIALLWVMRQWYGVVVEPEKYAVVRTRTLPVMTTRVLL
jgi:hypothetical protein